MEGYVPGTPFVPEKTFEKVSTYGNQLTSAYQNALNARQRILKQERALEANKKKVRKGMAAAGIKQAGPQKFFQEQYLNKIEKGWGTLPDDEMEELLMTAESVYNILTDGLTEGIEEQRDQLQKLSLSGPNERRRVGGADQQFRNDFGLDQFRTLNESYQEGFKYGEDGFDNGLEFVEKDPVSGLPVVKDSKGNRFVWGIDQVAYFNDESYFDYKPFLEEYSKKSMYDYGEDDVSNKQFEQTWSRSVAEKLFENNFSYGGSDSDRVFRVSMASVEGNADIKKKLAETNVDILLGGNEITMTALELFYEGMIDEIPDNLKSVKNEETGETVKGELDLLIENAKEEYIEGTKFSTDASGSAKPDADSKRRSGVLGSGEEITSGSFRFTPLDKKDDFDPKQGEARIFRYSLGTSPLKTQIRDINIAGGEPIVQNVSFNNVAFTEDYDGEGVGLVVTLDRKQQVNTDKNIDGAEWTEARDKARDRGDATFMYDGKEYETDSELTIDGGNINISVLSTDTYFIPGDSDNFNLIKSAINEHYRDAGFFGRLLRKAEKALGIN